MLNPATFRLSDLTVDFFKANYLTGLKFYNTDTTEVPASFFQYYLDNANAKISDLTNVEVLERFIQAEKHDFYINDYKAFAFIPLNKIPCLRVNEVRAVYPTGQVLQVFPSEWMRLETVHSQLNLIPTSGTLAQILVGRGVDYLLVAYAGAAYLPHLWEVDYIAGMDETKIPRMIIDVLCKIAAIDVLAVMGNLIAPLGVQSHSLSVDGLSQSRSYALPPFKALFDLYYQQVYGSDGKSGLLGQIQSSYFGPHLVSL